MQRPGTKTRAGMAKEQEEGLGTRGGVHQGPKGEEILEKDELFKDTDGERKE